jgi:DNA-binding transcriptional LysR family regulator
MDQLRAMRVFARVVDDGSFAAASRTLELAPAVVTRLVAELEEHLGARLMHRTTRRLALTEVGENYLERARRILAETDDADASAREATTEVRGHLRLASPPEVAIHQLAKHLPEFHRRHPQVTLEWHTSGPPETVEVDERHDMTLILARGTLEGEFVARPLARSEVILCASAEYLSRRGRPAHPSELLRHDLMVPSSQELTRTVTFVAGGADGSDAPAQEWASMVPRRPLLAADHIDTMYAAARHGLGIAGLPSFVVGGALLGGELERVLPAWRLFALTLWAAMPSRKHLPARTRAFLEFLLEVFGGANRDPWLAAASRGPSAPALR